VDAWLDLDPSLAPGLEGIEVGDEIIVITWLHLAARDVLRVRPRGEQRAELTGVFNTRSPDRPNPIGLHRVTVRTLESTRLLVGPVEALDGTPVLDIKPVLAHSADS
jgi:tRNA-Thr(GGU) m(6)t(6)A37 methyltransferase TsaA